MTNVLRELVEPVDLCDGRGGLSPAAVGWSRRPLHRTNLRGAVGRKKRWDYWCILAPDLRVAMTYADVDYLGLASVWIHQPSTGLELSVDRAVPFGLGFRSPDRGETGRMHASIRGFDLVIDEKADRTVIWTWCRDTPHGVLDASFEVARPDGHESMSVVVPWSERRFQYTTKDNTRPVVGALRLGDTRVELDGAAGDCWGVLDAGRGVWPYETRWNWGSASGVTGDGRLVGLQFGGKWTEGTGSTENALCVDGRLHKLHDELEWSYSWDRPTEPWRVRDVAGGRVDAVLTPDHDKHSKVSAGVLSMEVHQCFGRWSGELVTDDGETVRFDGLAGFAEEARNKW